MRRAIILIAASLALMTAGLAQAQVAGSTVFGVAAAELREVATGWSAKRQVLGRPVFNDKNEKVATPRKPPTPTIAQETALSGEMMMSSTVPKKDASLNQKSVTFDRLRHVFL
jgi:hypothetical protein